MSPTLTGIAACLASASTTLAPTPAALVPEAVDFEEAEASDTEGALANLEPAEVAKAAAGPKVDIRSPRPVELFVVTGEASAVTANGSAYAVPPELGSFEDGHAPRRHSATARAGRAMKWRLPASDRRVGRRTETQN